MSDIKQVIVLRKDLNMRKGKMVAQGAHASMKVFFDRMFNGGDMVGRNKMVFTQTPEDKEWMDGKFTKICVSVDSEEELLSVHQKACDAGINCAIIKDAGLTEFDGVETYTAVAIGPASSEKIDPITGDLKLL